MPSFQHEVELGVSASSLWLAMKDQNTLFPKLIPEAISSIENLEGEGQPGSVRLIKFGSKAPEGSFVKEKLVSIDHASFTVVSEELEGGHKAQFGFTKWVTTIKLTPLGDDKSKLEFKGEYEGGSEKDATEAIAQTKGGVTHTFKALEEHVKKA